MLASASIFTVQHQFKHNTFTNIERIGMYANGLLGPTNAVFLQNTYTGKGDGDWLDYGIEVERGAQVTIQGNTITNCTGIAASDGSGSAAILVTTFFGPGTTANLIDNTITNNTVGIAVGYDASDTAVVTATGNTFTDNEYPVSAQNAGNINLESFLADNTIDKAVSVDGIYVLYSSIQEAINDAPIGGTVNVAAGTYTEQITINKDITLLGDGDDVTTIQAFDSMPICFSTSYNYRPVVCIMNATATIDGFTIDGLGLGNTNNRFVGVAFRNAGGTLQNSTIKDIRDTPFSGTQHGVAVYSYNDDATARTIHVLDNTIIGFQKNAMALNASDTNPLTVDVQRNVITGAGVTTVTAQNGIQVWAPSGSGVVAGNSISGIAYDGGGWVATSILNYYTDLNTTSNIITGSHMGIYYYDAQGLIDGNELTILNAGGYGYGINAADPPAHPIPFNIPANTAIKTPLGSGIHATLAVEIKDNTLSFSGTDNTGSVAIEADAGYGSNDLGVNIHHNLATGFDYGAYLFQCDPATYTDCTTSVFTDISVVSNNLVDNNTGLYLGGPISSTVIPVINFNRFFSNSVAGLDSDLTENVVAENNWWGCNAGPNTTYCDSTAGTVDADPWLILRGYMSSGSMEAGETQPFQVRLYFNNLNQDTRAQGTVMDGIPGIVYPGQPAWGTVDPATIALVNGIATSNFTAGNVRAKPPLQGALMMGMHHIPSPLSMMHLYLAQPLQLARTPLNGTLTATDDEGTLYSML